MSDLKQFLQLIDRRKAGWQLDADVLAAIDVVKELLEKHFTGTPHTPDLVLRHIECWKVLSRSEINWELLSLSLQSVCLAINDGLFSDTFSEEDEDTKRAVTEFLGEFQASFKLLALHSEPRIRNQVVDVVKLYAAQSYVGSKLIFQELRAPLVERIRGCWHRQESHFSPSFSSAAASKSASSLQPGIPASMSLDDTTGWKDLETSLRCLQGLLIALADKSDFETYNEIPTGLFELVILQPARHINRYVRQCSLEFSGEYLRALKPRLDSPENLEGGRYWMLSSTLSSLISEVIGLSLDDDWGQLRLAGCLCAKEFFEVLPGTLTESHHGTLIPRLCLNRLLSLCVLHV
jgi:hypothetical protein